VSDPAAAGTGRILACVVASLVAPLILAVLVMILLMMVGAALVGFLAWRAGRRRWRLFRARMAGGGVAALYAIVTEGVVRRRGAPTRTDVDSWSALRARREMWRVVDLASSAVSVAERAGGPVADLPALCSRLHASAADLDQILRVEPANGPSGHAGSELRRHVSALIQAAHDVQGAAVAAASDAHSPKLGALTRDASVELDCLGTGMARAGLIGPHPDR